MAEEFVRKLQKTGEDGESYIVTLPKELVQELGWRAHQKVVIEKHGKKLIITDWEK